MPLAATGRLPAKLGRQFGRVRSPESLGAKLVLIMTAVGIVAAIAITLLLAAIITPSFTTLENKAIAVHIERTRAMLAAYAAEAESAARDQGEGRAGHADIAQPGTAFERGTVSPSGMGTIGVQGMAYVSSTGRVVGARWREPSRGVDNADDRVMRERLVRMIGRTNLTRVLAGRSAGHFYARIGEGVAAVGVATAGVAGVGRSAGIGGSRGYVLVARVITAQQISGLLQRNAKIDLTARQDAETIMSNRSKLTIMVPMIGADGHAVAGARITLRRDVTLLGRRMLLLTVAGSTVLLLLVLIVLRLMIARLVLRPLHRIERQMQRVRASGSLARLTEDGRRDEIGSLGRSFNAMLRQLQDLREQIEVQSFDLGRSESAVAVMHNVRNALNPISTILSQEVAQVPSVDRATLDRAIGELARGDVPEGRRHKLAAFVAAAIETERTHREATRRALTVGREAMVHVLDIIGQQQKAAHERPTLELCNVTDIVARNATIARYADGASIALTFPAGPVYVMASRVILSQVIGNLFSNAAESIAARGLGSGSIAASIAQADGRVTVMIRDDGEGFSKDVAATLFQRGFSTRAHKSGGLGLHWCANSMTAMGGALRLESEGLGLGAVAILTLLAGHQPRVNAA